MYNLKLLIVFLLGALMRGIETITPIDQYVIDFVRELRHRRRLTQDDIANILSVSRSFIKGVENIDIRAKYNIRHVNALADYFGMSPKDFFPDKPFPVNPSAKQTPAKKNEPAKKKTVKSTRSR